MSEAHVCVHARGEFTPSYRLCEHQIRRKKWSKCLREKRRRMCSRRRVEGGSRSWGKFGWQCRCAQSAGTSWKRLLENHRATEVTEKSTEDERYRFSGRTLLARAQVRRASLVRNNARIQRHSWEPNGGVSLVVASLWFPFRGCGSYSCCYLAKGSGKKVSGRSVDVVTQDRIGLPVPNTPTSPSIPRSPEEVRIETASENQRLPGPAAETPRG